MAKASNPSGEDKTAKKKKRKQIIEKLDTALQDLKSSLGEKKFNKRISQAGKLLSKGIKKKKK